MMTEGMVQYRLNQLMRNLEYVRNHINAVLSNSQAFNCEDIINSPDDVLFIVEQQAAIFNDCLCTFDKTVKVDQVDQRQTQISDIERTKITEINGRLSTRLFDALIRDYGRYNSEISQRGGELTVETIIKYGKDELKKTRSIGKTLYLEMVNYLCDEFRERREDWI